MDGKPQPQITKTAWAHDEFLDGEALSPTEERTMVRKMDYNIFPIIICLYILSFLDRVNIGTSTQQNPRDWQF
jgi:hypothetical protein